MQLILEAGTLYKKHTVKPGLRSNRQGLVSSLIMTDYFYTPSLHLTTFVCVCVCELLFDSVLSPKNPKWTTTACEAVVSEDEVDMNGEEGLKEGAGTLIFQILTLVTLCRASLK